MAPKIQAKPTSKPTKTETHLAYQQDQDPLNFIICGSDNDSKTALIGNLIQDSPQPTDDQSHVLKNELKIYGAQTVKVETALLIDGFSSDREQSFKADVPYRSFANSQRKFIAENTSSVEQYIYNMVAGAPTAEMAIVLVDAQQCILKQTRRHAYLMSLIGIRHVVLAVNNMELVDFDAKIFQRISKNFERYAQKLDFISIASIPLSVLNGDNIVSRSTRTPWYSGPTLMGHMETIELNTPKSERLVFPVQWINRSDASFMELRGYVGEGKVCVGDEIRVTRSGQTASVAEIIGMNGPTHEARHGNTITLITRQEVDASCGDVISLSQSPLESTDQFEATLVWISEKPGLIGRSYDIKLATQYASASITGLKHKVDINTLKHEASKQLKLNDISVCTLAINKPIAFDSYRHSKTLGSFILFDHISNSTIAVGMINHSLRRAKNVHKQTLSITRSDREKLNGQKSRVIWFTGLSGSGKSTLANALEVELHALGHRTYILDGDNVRQGLNKDLGFTDADRVENIRRISEVAKLMMDAGLIVITAFISPFARERQMARELIGEENFIEVYVSTSLEVCEQRDVKGLYKKARSGELPNLSGIGSPYEPPLTPDFNINTKLVSLKEATDQLISAIH